jgi:outer membrane protein OmpA-like peptidoglycan-associated protein
MISLNAFTTNAQDANLVLNHSFENLSGKVNSPGAIILADSMSSSNNTTVDIFTKDACSKYYGVPENYMGSQPSKTGNNYAGFLAYYADEAGFFEVIPGYQKYSEYTQMKLKEPLVAGKSYTISYNVALAETSAFAISGIGVYFSNYKINQSNNAFLTITPDIIWADVQTSTEWTTLTSTYVAFGGEQYLTLGAFQDFIEVKKVIEPNTNNSRKSYYYLDEVSLTPSAVVEPSTSDFSIISIMAGSCFQLKNLNFETDKAIILESSFAELDLLSDFLKMYPAIQVYLDGYTDKTGTKQYNVVLSEERALAVKKYLTNDGIKESRLLASGYGEILPIDKKNENSFTNRRVEVTLCDNSKD